MRTHSLSGHSLSGKRIAILVDDGFEQIELTSPMSALTDAGAKVDIIAPETGHVRGWNHTDWGERFAVARTLDQARPDEYDALLLPGGVMNPDRLRARPAAVDFARAFMTAGKPVAAICHGPQLLIEADAVRGRRLTSYPSVRKDLVNAGAIWKDEEAVVDQGLVTSRSPDDLDAFNRAMIEEFTEGRHQGRSGTR